MSFAEAGLVISSGFMAGILASAHCVVMCGGIAVLVAQQKYGLAQHFLRLFVYILLAVTAGALLESFIDVPRWILGVALVAAGLISWYSQRKAKKLQALGPQQVKNSKVFFSTATENRDHECHSQCQHHHNPKSSKMLWLWGFLPCPMVFMMISTSATLKPSEAGLMMAGFGLGTLPALLSMSYGAGWFLKKLKVTRPWFQFGLVAAGTWVLVLDVIPMHFLMDHHAHMNMSNGNHMHMDGMEGMDNMDGMQGMDHSMHHDHHMMQ